MGTYINPGKFQFEITLNSEIYVDKTDMILYLNTLVNTEQRYVCVSRPRRFGKSVTANMLCAYYGEDEGNFELFNDRKIAEAESWDKYLGEFQVVRLVITDFMKKKSKRLSIADMIDNINEKVAGEISKAYTDVDFSDKEDLIQTMEDLYQAKKKQFVIVIDEWDAVFREYKEDLEGHKLYLDFLRDWLKGKSYVALAYMTGILPIKKYGKHSALNMFDEYSMIAPMQLARYTGFTDKEMTDLCKTYNMSISDMKEWYDGYLISDEIPVEFRKAYRSGDYHGNNYHEYSPLSVVNALRSGIIRNYWNQTETYEALAEYINKDFDGLREVVAMLMEGGREKVSIGNYQNDMTTFNSKDDILTLLIHLGYLGYDFDNKEVFIPNNEILDEFKNSTKAQSWDYLFAILQKSQDILEATWNLDEQRVAALLEEAHNKADNKTYNSEAALSYAIQLAYYSAQNYYTSVRELDSGKGYADLVYIPAPEYSDRPVLLIELKYNERAETAIDQILRNDYPQVLEHYKGNILLVGINYDKDTSPKSEGYKRHECRILKA
ncbi:AAA family ATPase [Butyrivibrio sp. AC2005]|uniref:AAA family ATPase n=1 Tax=Butyrivibrio sp. AC2005 TaxID=1280672 RepID=UPI0003FA1450|nr:AAA family ATPase [Butyrivibrio sp. AC2005]